MLSLRTRHPREIDFRLLRSVGAKNYGFVSSDAHKEAGGKILPQGVYGRARPLGGRNRKQGLAPRGARRYTERKGYANSFAIFFPKRI